MVPIHCVHMGTFGVEQRLAASSIETALVSGKLVPIKSLMSGRRENGHVLRSVEKASGLNGGEELVTSCLVWAGQCVALSDLLSNLQSSKAFLHRFACHRRFFSYAKAVLYPRNQGSQVDNWYTLGRFILFSHSFDSL